MDVRTRTARDHSAMTSGAVHDHEGDALAEQPQLGPPSTAQRSLFVVVFVEVAQRRDSLTLWQVSGQRALDERP
jgi:hypothetical protein